MYRFSSAAIAAVSAVTFAQIASAADLPRKAPSAVPPPPVSSWTGFYVGANVGYGWNNSSATESAADPASGFPIGGFPVIGTASASFDRQGWAGGLQAGYNWQFDPRWVAGVEADFDWSNIKGSGSVYANLTNFPNAGVFNASQKVDWFGTVRARLGYLATNDLLVYATGGLAYGKVNQSADFGVNPGFVVNVFFNGFSFACANPASGSAGTTCFAGSDSRTSVGWTVGGGAEYRFAQNFSLKLEYLYVNLGSETFNIPAATLAVSASSPSILKVSFDDTAFNLVRAGLNYRF